MNIKNYLNTNLKVYLFSMALLFMANATGQTNVFDDVIAMSPNHTSLKAALIQAQLDDDLKDPSGTFTVFAPTNAAFDELAQQYNTTVAGLLALPNLSDILLYHVLGAEVASGVITNGSIVTPLFAGNTLKLTKKMGTNAVYINHAMVTVADLTTDNGVVHVTDGVLLPVETVVDIALDNNFSSLTAALVKAELLPALSEPFGTYTVFAPSNSAFATLATKLNTNEATLLTLPNLSDILLYHVLGTKVQSGDITNGALVSPLNPNNTLKLTKLAASGDVYLNQAKISGVDIMATNGIVHVIDNVVLPFKTVADVAIDNNFTSLTAAVVKAELLPALTDPFDTVTVFAPSNAAFDRLASKLNTDINGLLNLPNLKDILLYHVLGSRVLSSAISNGGIVTPLNTANTLKLTKMSSNGMIYLNHAKVTGADISASNGVVHVLDEVVLPRETVVDVALDNNFSYLGAALVRAELLPELLHPFKSFTVFAPTNAAFDNLANSLGTNIGGLLDLPELSDILLYHVSNGKLNALNLSNGSLPMLSGQNTIVSVSNGVQINNSEVTVADLNADNGVVHVIDEVLLSSFLSVKDIEDSKNYLVYPNPAVEHIIVNQKDGSSYQLMDLNGKVLASGTILNNKINVQLLSTGSFIARIVENEAVYNLRFNKQ